MDTIILFILFYFNFWPVHHLFYSSLSIDLRRLYLWVREPGCAAHVCIGNVLRKKNQMQTAIDSDVGNSHPQRGYPFAESVERVQVKRATTMCAQKSLWES